MKFIGIKSTHNLQYYFIKIDIIFAEKFQQAISRLLTYLLGGIKLGIQTLECSCFYLSSPS